MILSIQQRQWIIEKYYSTGHKVNKIRNTFQLHFHQNPPARSVIYKLVNKFRETGSVLNRKKNRAPTSRTEERIEQVRARIDDDPKTSVRRISAETTIPRATVWEILRKNLHRRPYKARPVQKLFLSDHEKRVQFCRLWLQKVTRVPRILYITVWTDEAIFHLSGLVNSQNFRLWAEQDPHYNWELEMRSEGLSVYCAVYAGGIIGPFFFPDVIKNGKRKPDTVNRKSYLHLLKTQLIPAIRAIPALRSSYIMQDGAPAHYALEVRDWFNINFRQRWIGRAGPILWPPRPPVEARI